MEVKYEDKGGPITDATVKAVKNLLQADVVGGLLALQDMEDNRGTTLNESFHSYLKKNMGMYTTGISAIIMLSSTIISLRTHY